MEERDIWIDIIAKLYKDMHTSSQVMHTALESDKKRKRIIKYFERLDKVINKVQNSKNDKILKKYFYDLYIIDSKDIPESYFKHENEIKRQMGELPLSKDTIIKKVVSNQKASLNEWLDYFLYGNGRDYEIWEKWWIFQGIMQLGKFNKETGKFIKRRKNTVYPFINVNESLVSSTLNLMRNYIIDKSGDTEIKSALGSGNFKTLYEYVINHQVNEDTCSLPGIWIKYSKETDYHILKDTLKEHYTGWCTAVSEMAKGQLENGDMYIYYSLTSSGDKIPRIAIRTEGINKIVEIRGIAYKQNIEPDMLPILDEKLQEFPNKDSFFKKQYDMQYLTTIEGKMNHGLELNQDDLRFLYEIDDIITGFGYLKDPRIDEIKSKRDAKKDLGLIFGVEKEQVSVSVQDINQNTRVFFGNISKLSKDKLRYLKNIDTVVGNLDLNNFKKLKSVTLPKKVCGLLDLSNLILAKDLVLPEEVIRSVDLSSMDNIKGITLPLKIGRNLDLSGVITAENLDLDIDVGSIYLNSLEHAKGLKLPKLIKGSLNLSGLVTNNDLVLPLIIKESLYLDNLLVAKDLVLPEIVGLDLNLCSLQYAHNVTFPTQVVNLDLSSLEEGCNLSLPNVLGDVYLWNLKSAETINLPSHVGGQLYLNGLTSTVGLRLPDNFDLDSLVLSESVKQELNGKTLVKH